VVRDKFHEIVLTGLSPRYAIPFTEGVIHGMDSVMDVVIREARAYRTVLLTARESDGSVESREVEPYSIRPGGPGKPDRLFAYCLERSGTRSWHIPNIISAEATGREFEPQWPVEL
jgi:hypothetical protein